MEHISKSINVPTSTFISTTNFDITINNSVLSGPGPAINAGSLAVPLSLYVDTGSSINLQLQNTLSGTPDTLLSCATSGVTINGKSTAINSSYTEINSRTITLNGTIIDNDGYMYGSNNGSNITIPKKFSGNTILNLYPIGYTFTYIMPPAAISSVSSAVSTNTTSLSNGVWLISATQSLTIGNGTTNSSSYTRASLTTSSSSVCTLSTNPMTMPIPNTTCTNTLYFPLSNSICTVFNATATTPVIQFSQSTTMASYVTTAPTVRGLYAIFTKIA